MLPAFAALVVFQLLGGLLVRRLGLPFPGALAGMLLMFACMALHGRIPQALERTSGALLQHMMLLLIPAIAGVMVHFRHMASEWQPFVAACIAGAVVTLAVTALTLNWLLKRQARAMPEPTPCGSR